MYILLELKNIFTIYCLYMISGMTLAVFFPGCLHIMTCHLKTATLP